jgi:HTH-type transcriptional regulator/antitoxin HipB
MSNYPGRIAAVDPDFDISGLLRRARRIADLSQRDLAARAGVSPSTVGRAESGNGAVSVRMLIRLFAAAGMRLAVHDAAHFEIPPMRPDCLRDRGGRRHAAHLDPEPTIRDGWTRGPWSRGSRPEPVAVQERREMRDWRRQRELEPDDHPGPESLYRRPQRLQPIAPSEPIPDCECGPACERECVQECNCQCEPLGASVRRFSA